MKYIYMFGIASMLLGTADCMCKIENACIKGNDLLNLNNFEDKNNVRQCERRCNSRGNCKAFDYYKDLSLCHYKTAVMASMQAGQVDSYSKSCSPTKPKSDNVSWKKSIETKLERLNVSISNGEKMAMNSSTSKSSSFQALSVEFALQQFILEKYVPDYEYPWMKQGNDFNVKVHNALVLCLVLIFALIFFELFCCCEPDKERKDYFQISAKEPIKQGDLSWFCIYSFNFFKGNVSQEECCSFEEAKRLILTKPRTFEIAYTYSEEQNALFVKPTGKNAQFSAQPNPCNLFVFGVYTGIQMNGKYLMQMEGCIVKGQDDAFPQTRHQEGLISTKGQAMNWIEDFQNCDCAYYWCRVSKTIIQKKASNGETSVLWDKDDGYLFIWADKIIN